MVRGKWKRKGEECDRDFRTTWKHARITSKHKKEGVKLISISEIGVASLLLPAQTPSP